MLDTGPTNPLRLIVGQDYFDLTEEVGARVDFLRFKSLLDGRHTLDEIAARTSLDRPIVEDVVATLQSAGLLRRESPRERIEGPQLLQQLTATLQMWRRQIGYHRLFTVLSTGEARLQVLQGLFIETYHVVRLAAHHIAVALNHAAENWERELLTDYLHDEASHAPLMLETCARLGLRQSDIVAAQPTIGTTSLINMLREIGRTDTLAYFASTSLFEAMPEDLSEGLQTSNAITDAYHLPSNALETALAHMQTDVAAGHTSLLEHAMRHHPSISSERAHRVVNLLHDLKHGYDQHHDQILQYYSDVSNYIPRQRVDYFSL